MLALLALLVGGCAEGSAGCLYQGEYRGPSLRSESAIVRLVDTGEIVLRKDSDSLRPIASVTKLLSGLVMSRLRWDAEMLLSIEEVDKDTLKHSRSPLRVGLVATFSELMLAGLSGSDNRAMHAAVRAVMPRESFVSSMNEMARKLGMRQSRFYDPTGLDPRNVATARELLAVLAAAAANERVRHWASAPQIEFEHDGEEIVVRNPDRLLHSADWDVVVGKTGYTVEAGRTFVVRVILEQMLVDMVFLGSREMASIFGDAARVRRWLSPHLAQKKAAAAAVATAN